MVIHGELDTGLVSGSDDGAGVSKSERHRLLGEDVLAGSGCGNCVGGVLIVAGRDVDRVDVAAEQFVEISREQIQVVVAPELESFLIGIEECLRGDVVGLEGGNHATGGDVAGSDEPKLEIRHGA